TVARARRRCWEDCCVIAGRLVYVSREEIGSNIAILGESGPSALENPILQRPFRLHPRPIMHPHGNTLFLDVETVSAQQQYAGLDPRGQALWRQKTAWQARAAEQPWTE